MKVLHINSFGRYSTGNIAGEILSSLPKTDEKMLIYGRDDSDFAFAKKINTKTSAFFHVLFNKLFGGQGRYSHFNTVKILNEIKRFNPDIIHLHNIHGYYINYDMLFRYIKKHNIKVVWTLHDCWAFTGYCSYFDYVGCDKWQTGCKSCPLYNKVGYNSLVDTSKRDYFNKEKAFTGVKNMTIVTPSKWLADLVKQSFLKEYNVKVINNGINLDKFNYFDNHNYDNIVDRNKKILLGVAFPFSERKGYSDFIKLSTMLSTEYQIVMVGLDDGQIENLPKNVVGIKKTKNQIALAELYSIASVFINLTYEDNFPTTNIEALSCGTPVITYNTGGSIESITEKNGLIVDKGNLESVVSAVENITNKIIDRKQISMDAREEYSKEKMACEYCKLYNKEELF